MRKRIKADWVFRPNAFDGAGALVDDLGTYTPIATNLVAGIGGALGKVLYDSHNYVKSSNIESVVNAAEFYLLPSARAEGARARILRVQGVMLIRPTTWTVGSIFHLGIRFGIFEQDSSSGVFLVDPLYSMWSTASANENQPAKWANDRKWQREFRFLRTFSSGNEQNAWQFAFNFGVNRRLMPHECYGVYMETLAGDATLAVQRYLRTLVSDEG